MKNLKIEDFKGKVIHFIGIGGISMSGLAQILSRKGFVVQGSDIVKNEETEFLNFIGIKVFFGHSPKNLDGVDVVVYNSAIHDDNAEFIEAKRRGIVMLKRAEVLGIVANCFKWVVAVAGSHGKTTASAMIGEIFLKAKVDPTLHIGGKMNYIGSNYFLGKGRHFVTEACEYEDNFLEISPDVAVLLNIDSDHLDYFKNLDNLKDSFLDFKRNIRCGGIVVACQDDKNLKQIRNDGNVTTFGFSSKSDMRATNVREYESGKYQFDAEFMGSYLGTVKLNIFGKHNIYNALAATVVSLAFGIDFGTVKSALENFCGVERRCEEVGNINGARVIHDYAHHPEQIKKMIDVACKIRPLGGRVTVVFEPHTFSRTKYLINDFAKSFKRADMVVLLPVYSARERESEGFDSKILMERVSKYNKNIKLAQSYDEVLDCLKRIANHDDVILVLGAGSIEQLAKKIKNLPK